jgi:hypothetical protein
MHIQSLVLVNANNAAEAKEAAAAWVEGEFERLGKAGPYDHGAVVAAGELVPAGSAAFEAAVATAMETERLQARSHWQHLVALVKAFGDRPDLPHKDETCPVTHAVGIGIAGILPAGAVMSSETTVETGLWKAAKLGRLQEHMADRTRMRTTDGLLYDGREDTTRNSLSLTAQDPVWAVLVDFHY